MKCGSCKVQIGAEFTHAIKNNLCPACGNSIMQQEKLASYLSLKTLLENNFSDIDVEKIATLVVANFELKQMFKEELQKDSESGNIEVEEDEEDPEETVVLDDGIKLEVMSKAEKKKALQKMRDEAFNGARKEQYDTDFTESELLLTEGVGNHEFKTAAKQKASYDAMNSGSGIVNRSGG